MPRSFSILPRYFTKGFSMTDAELETHRLHLLALQNRLYTDVRDLADEALGKSGDETNVQLSHVPIHLADQGTDNFEQQSTTAGSCFDGWNGFQVEPPFSPQGSYQNLLSEGKLGFSKRKTPFPANLLPWQRSPCPQGPSWI